MGAAGHQNHQRNNSDKFSNISPDTHGDPSSSCALDLAPSLSAGSSSAEIVLRGESALCSNLKLASFGLDDLEGKLLALMSRIVSLSQEAEAFALCAENHLNASSREH